jgi:hypothetical protein
MSLSTTVAALTGAAGALRALPSDCAILPGAAGLVLGPSHKK